TTQTNCAKASRARRKFNRAMGLARKVRRGVDCRALRMLESFLAGVVLVIAATVAVAQPVGRPAAEGAAPPAGGEVPEGGVARLGTLRFRSSHVLSRVAFAPDGKSIVVAGVNGLISRYSVATRQMSHAFPVAGGTITRLTFSPDGKYLAATGVAGVVSVFDA